MFDGRLPSVGHIKRLLNTNQLTPGGTSLPIQRGTGDSRRVPDTEGMDPMLSVGNEAQP